MHQDLLPRDKSRKHDADVSALIGIRLCIVFLYILTSRPVHSSFRTLPSFKIMASKVLEADSEKGLSEVKSEDLELNGNDTQPLKLDKNGLPLNPQPTNHKDDPLVRCSYPPTALF